MAQKILIIGASGMLGHKLMQHLGRDFEAAGTLREDASRYDALKGMRLYTGIEATDLDAVRGVMTDFKPDVLVNSVGIIKQLEESKAAEPSIAINALLPHQLARLAGDAGARLIHFSTDCVFSGKTDRPYTEADPSDAEDLYGKSKYLGEVSVAPHLTMRTSIIGPELRGKKSLVEWVLSRRRQDANGYAKALYTGVTTREMANIIRHVLTRAPQLAGLYHVSADAISKYDLIEIMNNVYNLGITLHKDEAFTCDRRLDSARFRRDAGYTPPAWQQMIEEMADDHG